MSHKRYTLKLSFVFTGDDTNQGKIVFKCVSVVSYTSWKISILVCVCFGRRFSYYYISYKATLLIKFSGDLDEYQQISFRSIMLHWSDKESKCEFLNKLLWNNFTKLRSISITNLSNWHLVYSNGNPCIRIKQQNTLT